MIRTEAQISKEKTETQSNTCASSHPRGVSLQKTVNLQPSWSALVKQKWSCPLSASKTSTLCPLTHKQAPLSHATIHRRHQSPLTTHHAYITLHSPVRAKPYHHSLHSSQLTCSAATLHVRFYCYTRPHISEKPQTRAGGGSVNHSPIREPIRETGQPE